MEFNSDILVWIKENPLIVHTIIQQVLDISHGGRHLKHLTSVSPWNRFSGSNPEKYFIGKEADEKILQLISRDGGNEEILVVDWRLPVKQQVYLL